MRLKSWKELQEKYFKQYLCGRYLFNIRDKAQAYFGGEHKMTRCEY